MTLLKIIYWAALIMEIFIRAPYQRKRRADTGKTVNAASRTEVILLTLLFIAGLPLPLIYTFTGWLGFADYRLPAWSGWLGAAVMALGVFVFYRANRDLRHNWSPTLEVYGEHTLITEGIYSKIRHPMYLSQLLVATAQALLLWNWLAGTLSIVVFALFYLFRVPEEEKMMLAAFGEPYREYMKRTGGIIPRMRLGELMNHKMISLTCWAVLCVIFLTGCSSNQVKQVEVTRIVRETVVVTEAAPTATIAPIQTQTQTPEPVDKSIFSVENNEIRILVTEYYVLIDHGLHEEAFNLLHPSFQEIRNLEEYVEGSSVIYDQVKLLRLEAYDEFIERAGLEKFVPPEGSNYVHVNLMAFHKGAKPDEGVFQQLFVQVKQTDNGWRISNFWTSLPTR